MKVLVAYDGSKPSETAIDDLVRAGLSHKGTAHILSVAEVSLPQPARAEPERLGVPSAAIEIAAAYKKFWERSVTEANILAKHAKERIRRVLPEWDVSYASTYGSPAREILDAADRLQPHLIVLGAHGQSDYGRFLLGSISQKVLTEAQCSVRIARGKIEIDDCTPRIVIGFDGSNGTLAAVRLVAQRNWGPDAKVHLVTASEPTTPDSIGRFVPPICRIGEEINNSDRRLFEQLGINALETLSAAGIEVIHHIRPGSPKQVLIEEAERWGADCIFVGASSGTRLVEQMLLGATSSAVAARAHCSVEVVRERIEKQPGNQMALNSNTKGTKPPAIEP